MDNTYVYIGHTNQTIHETNNINTGIELFNKSRIHVPKGYKFITFHFNDKYTTGSFTAPFILYGLKNITEEDIESLFDLENKTTNTNTFKRKMFKSFVQHYTEFVITRYNDSMTLKFDKDISKAHIFRNYETMINFINFFVENNFTKICNIHNIKIEDYKIIGKIDEKYLNDIIIGKPDDIYLNLKDKLYDYYNNDFYVSLFLSHYNKYNEIKPEPLFKLTIEKIMKKKIKNILLNHLTKNKKINPIFKNMENMTKIILNDYLLDRFYDEFFILLLSDENIEAIKYDNCEQIINLLFKDDIMFDANEHEKIKTRPWEINNTTSESIARKISIRPFRTLMNSIDKFDGKLIDDICNYFNFFIRSYDSNVLTPILFFNDQLVFMNRDNNYNMYKYGFYDLNKYKKLNEVAHNITEYYPPRDIKHGLSKYSFNNDIPEYLSFYDNHIYNYKSKHITRKIINVNKKLYIRKLEYIVGLEQKYKNNSRLYNERKYIIKEEDKLRKRCTKGEIFYFAKKYKNKEIKYNTFNEYVVSLSEIFLKYINSYFDTVKEDIYNYFDTVKNDVYNNFNELKSHVEKYYNNTDLNILLSDLVEINNELHAYTLNETYNKLIINNNNYEQALANNYVNVLQEIEINIDKPTNDKEKFIYNLITFYRIIYFILNYDSIVSIIGDLDYKNILSTLMDTFLSFAFIVRTNFFNYLNAGTYIITSCGTYTESLKNHYKNLSKKEQQIFNEMTKEYDTYWRNKYLKYKQKYLKLKSQQI